jgi:recombinational DNA repair protein RecR
MIEQPTNREIMEAVRGLDGRFQGLEGRFQGLEGAVQGNAEAIHALATHMDERFDAVERRSDRLEGRVTNIESTMATKADLARMVTKDYLDDKLADLHSDIVRFVKRRVPGWSEA